MVQITENQYDSDLAGGDNNPTQVTQYVNSSMTRVTNYLYDWRNRHTDTDGEVDFYEQFCYDNLDHVIRDDHRDTTASGNLIARSTTAYDDRGQVYQSVRYGVDPTMGLAGNALTDNTWYDNAGNALKSQPADAQTFSKRVYDGIGRVTAEYAGYSLSNRPVNRRAGHARVMVRSVNECQASERGAEVAGGESVDGSVDVADRAEAAQRSGSSSSSRSAGCCGRRVSTSRR